MKNVTSDKRNLWMFPLGTVGRDMIYNLFTNFIFTYILFTRHLTAAQLGAVTAIMVGARVFDALNDPVMGNIIERTRSRYGKFKPWLVIGILSTSVVVYLAFNTSLQGWSFIAFFGVIYFLYSITYTMHDISYWGMVSALSSDPHVRNSLTSRTNLFAGIGGVIASILIPMLTTAAARSAAAPQRPTAVSRSSSASSRRSSCARRSSACVSAGITIRRKSRPSASKRSGIPSPAIRRFSGSRSCSCCSRSETTSLWAVSARRMCTLPSGMRAGCTRSSTPSVSRRRRFL